MGADVDFLVTLGAMACAAYACRVGGFLLMRYVPVTPRVEAALRATPLGVMIGIVMPAVSAGKPPELIALLVIAIAMKLTRNDLAAALAGVATIAVCRWLLPA